MRSRQPMGKRHSLCLGCESLAWLLAGLFLWLAPRRLVRIRQFAAWVMPALPVFVIAAQVLVSLLYGPLPA
ncbi:hypothetical protein Misp03_71600 [Microbispora sp. NBRC 16548]|nr:hypothetical protein Misp03_71600 [Microbispora sp. NBRC 16548]